MNIIKLLFRKSMTGRVRNRLIKYSIGLLLFNLFAIGLISYKVSTITITKIVSETNINILKQSVENIDFILKGIEYEAINAFQNADFIKYLDNAKSNDNNTRIKSFELCKSAINRYIYLKDEIDSVYIVGENGVILSNESFSNLTYSDIDRFRELLKGSNGGFIWTYMVIVKEEFGTLGKHIVVSKAIMDKDNNYKGFMLIVLKERALENIYKDIYKNRHQIFLVDENNIIVYCHDKDIIGEELDKNYKLKAGLSSEVKKINGKKHLVSSITSNYLGWNLYISQSYENIILNLEGMKSWIIAGIIAGVLGFISLSVIFSIIITRPIKRLVDHTDKISKIDKFFNCFNNIQKNKILSRFFNKMKFKTKLLIFLIGIIIIPIILLIWNSYSMTYNIVEMKAIEINTLNTNQMKKRIEYFLKNFEKSIYYLYTDTEVLKILKENAYVDNPEVSQVQSIIEGAVENIKIQNRIIHNISIYNNNQKLLYTSPSCFTPIFNGSYKLLSESDNVSMWFDTYRDIYNQFVITFGIKLKDIKDFSNIGYVFITINESDLQKSYINTLDNQNISFIVNSQGHEISYPSNKVFDSNYKNFLHKNIYENSKGWFKKSNNGKDYLINYNSILDTEWKIISITSFEKTKENMEKIILYDILVFFLSSIVVVIMVIYISNRISKPINKLTNEVMEFGNNNLESNNQNLPGDEIEQLSANFNKMRLRIKTLIEEVYEAKIKKHEAELSKKETELTILQAQINPHFLYNTLEIIKWKAMFLTGCENEVTDIISALSDFFRVSLSGGKKMIFIKDEIEHIKNYLKIMNYRYDYKIIVNLNIDAQILNFIIPKITLQPIIENAIYHGINDLDIQGIISIFGSIENEIIKIEIKDNGIGMSEECVDNLNRVIAEATETKERTGYGLKNVNQRIKLCFGDGYGLVIYSHKNKGTTVKITIPALNAQPGEEL